MSKAKKKPPAITRNVPGVCMELQGIQRQRAVVIKSRIMQANRIQAVVAGTLGYSASMSEKDRRAKFREAEALIECIRKGEDTTNPMHGVVQTTLIGVRAFLDMQESLEEQMETLARTLPVASWVEQEAQRGFGMPSLAVLVGETGDINGYATPAKLWRRMGCAPWTFEEKTLMGATWRSGKEGKLPASEWELFGYSPRRRSIAYVIGENLLRGNGTGPYRQRYDNTKAAVKQSHPAYSDLRCHRHGMLLATKLLLKMLWRHWTGKLHIPELER